MAINKITARESAAKALGTGYTDSPFSNTLVYVVGNIGGGETVIYNGEVEVE